MPVEYGIRVLPLFGHSPVVARTSKRGVLSRPKSEACLDRAVSVKTLMRRGRAAHGERPAQGDPGTGLCRSRFSFFPPRLIVLVVDQLAAVVEDAPTHQVHGPMRTDPYLAGSVGGTSAPGSGMNRVMSSPAFHRSWPPARPAGRRCSRAQPAAAGHLVTGSGGDGR